VQQICHPRDVTSQTTWILLIQGPAQRSPKKCFLFILYLKRTCGTNSKGRESDSQWTRCSSFWLNVAIIAHSIVTLYHFCKQFGIPECTGSEWTCSYSKVWWWPVRAETCSLVCNFNDNNRCVRWKYEYSECCKPDDRSCRFLWFKDRFTNAAWFAFAIATRIIKWRHNEQILLFRMFEAWNNYQISYCFKLYRSEVM